MPIALRFNSKFHFQVRGDDGTVRKKDVAIVYSRGRPLASRPSSGRSLRVRPAAARALPSVQGSRPRTHAANKSSRSHLPHSGSLNSYLAMKLDLIAQIVLYILFIAYKICRAHPTWIQHIEFPETALAWHEWQTFLYLENMIFIKIVLAPSEIWQP